MKQWLRHSVYEPFFARRDHRDAEIRETEALYERVRLLHQRFRYADEDALRAYKFELFAPIEERLPDELRPAFYAMACVLLRSEAVIFEMPEFHPSLSLKEMVELRDALRRKQHFHANEGRHLELLGEGIRAILGHIAGLVQDSRTLALCRSPDLCHPEPRQAHR